MQSIGTIKEIWRYPVKSMAGERLQRSEVGALGIPGDRGWAIRDEKAGEIRGAKKLPALIRCRARYLAEPTSTEIPPAEITTPDGAKFRSDSADASARLSELLGRTVTLWPIQPAANRDFYRRSAPDNPDMTAELREIFGRLEDEPIPDLAQFPREILEFTSPLGTYFDAFPFHVLTTASLRALAAHNPAGNFDSRRFRPNVLVETKSGIDGLAEAGWSGRTIKIGETRIKLEMPTVRCAMTTLEQSDLPKDSSVLRTIVREAAQNVGSYATVVRAGAFAIGDEVILE
jgi:uncharacterized protein YcbX